jgi:hypothetical protein
MPTLNDIIEAARRYGFGRVATVLFGLACMVTINLFRSTPAVDTAGNIVFGLLIAAAIFLKKKEDS